MEKIDETDMNILREFQKNARQSFREVAENLGVSEGTVYNRVNKLKEQGVIKGFIVDVDYAKLGYDLTAIIGIIVTGGKLSEIEGRLAKEEEITAVYDVTGRYDAIAVAKFSSSDALNDLVKRIQRLPNVERTYTMVALNTVKEAHGVKL
ncbi:MAG TPA: Lrp/AsnC family transcriptional regulator [Candidatus Altiarchaeales archaeon]|nr:Lrp/AsnC family transcriptional regulator [Candidatus Altiarchaeales archaeon]